MDDKSLFQLAVDLHLAGRLAEAQAACQALLDEDPDHAAALCLSGVIAQQKGQYATALLYMRRALTLQPHDLVFVCALASALCASQQYGESAVLYRRAVRLDPTHMPSWVNLGSVLQKLQQHAQAIECYQEILQHEPGNTTALLNLGIIHSARKEFDLAAMRYRALLESAPDQIDVHQNLAAVLQQQGLVAQAQQHLDHAYREQPVVIYGVEHPIKTVLVLWAAGGGNTPIDYLFPKSFYTLIYCMMEYASDALMRTLPPYDLVFNAIGDSSAAPATEAAVRRFRGVCTKPFLNSDERVGHTARDKIASLFAGIDQVVCAPTVELASSEFKQMVVNSGAVDFPIIVRPVGSHGGVHLTKLASAAELDALQLFNAPAYYASNYIDYRSADGFFRKFRMVFINRQAFAYHLAIGEHWIVHYQTADMLSADWKLEEEKAFLHNPRGVLGDQAMAAIEQVGQAMDLDFCGVDFSLLADGRIVVFEANATMLVHGEEPGGALHYKNQYVGKIFDAFNRYVAGLTTG